MENFQKWSGIAALYEAGAYIAGMVFFLVIVDYMSVVEPAQKMALLLNNQAGMYMITLASYVIFALFLVLLSLALYQRLKDGSPAIMQTATAFGLIWAALRTGKLPKGLNYIGLAVGIAGTISTIPPLGEIGGMIFGLGQIVWFIWLGIVLLRNKQTTAV